MIQAVLRTDPEIAGTILEYRQHPPRSRVVRSVDCETRAAFRFRIEVIQAGGSAYPVVARPRFQLGFYSRACRTFSCAVVGELVAIKLRQTSPRAET